VSPVPRKTGGRVEIKRGCEVSLPANIYWLADTDQLREQIKKSEALAYAAWISQNGKSPSGGRAGRHAGHDYRSRAATTSIAIGMGTITLTPLNGYE
jgi:hypothetical protein